MVEIISYWCLLVKGLNSVSRGQVLFSSSLLCFHLIAADLLALLASFVTRHVKFFLLVFPSSSARGNNDNRSKLKIVDAFTPRKEKKCVSLRGILILHVTLFQHACHIF